MTIKQKEINILNEKINLYLTEYKNRMSRLHIILKTVAEMEEANFRTMNMINTMMEELKELNKEE